MAPKVKEPKPAREETSDSESSSSSESNRKAEESSDSDSDSSSDNESVASAKGQNKQSNLIPSQARAARPAKSFKPPLGFKPAKNQPSSSTTSTTLSDLNGKQVFHITAPAYLPLSKVKEVSLAGALKGEPILKHDGVQYGIPPDSVKQAGSSGQTLFLHDSKSQTYRGTVTNVPTYHIQEIISLPGGSEYEEATVRAAEALIKPPRKQPKHLKMRFHPVGSGDAPPETLGSSAEESEEEAPSFKVPKGLEKEKEKKRKHQQTEADGSQSVGEPRKKSKKHSSDNVEHAGEEKSKKSKDRDGKKRKKEKTAA
ncbi:DNA-directed RNA polymerase I subunit RPA34.5-domain-containing protein [Aspergillus karnatakaensis]|uniref:DNA-directed RNA polymerase I subunit RPA34 n=1 Tax=Aspergillus karnatakaensis TaxID=1810916 RepID=UPI003CCE3491